MVNIEKMVYSYEVGDEFAEYIFHVIPEFNQQYLSAVEDYNSIYYEKTPDGKGPFVHPSLLINHSNIPKTPSFSLPPGMAAIHTHEEIQFINPGLVGKTFKVTWKVIDIYEKRNRKYQVKDVLVVDEDGLEIIRRKVTDTYLGNGE